MRPRTGIAAFLTALSAAGLLAATAAGSGSAALAASSNGNQVKPGELLVSEARYATPAPGPGEHPAS